jgi:hypothetical protein
MVNFMIIKNLMNSPHSITCSDGTNVILPARGEIDVDITQDMENRYRSLGYFLLTNSSHRARGIPVGGGDIVVVAAGESVELTESQGNVAAEINAELISAGHIAITDIIESSEAKEVAEVKKVNGKYIVLVGDSELSDKPLTKKQAQKLADDYNATNN